MQMHRVLLATLFTVIGAWAQAPSGRFDAAITIGSLKIPFTIEFEGSGAGLVGSIVNGDARIRSTAGSADAKTVSLQFEPSGARLAATLADGILNGTFGNAKTGMHAFKATAFCTCSFVGEAGPDVMGTWDAPD